MWSDPAECNTSTHNSRPPNATRPFKVVVNNCLIQQNVIQVHITLMCTCIKLCWTRQLFCTTLIGSMTFGGLISCVLVLYSAGPASYLTLLSLVPWHLEDESLDNCLIQQNVISVHIAPVLQIPRDHSK
jgi:hypothetical protein